MWRAALLLPLLQLSNVLATADDRLGTPSVTRTEPSASAATLEAPRELLYSPVSLFWHSLASFISNRLPGDASSAEPSFFNDLRIAFNLSHPNIGTEVEPSDDDETCQLEKREYIYIRDQQVLKTKCRVQSTLPQEEWNGGIPNYTPTGPDGRPLPTQTIGDGHGGYGQEVISVTSMCGNINPGATGKHQHRQSKRLLTSFSSSHHQHKHRSEWPVHMAHMWHRPAKQLDRMGASVRHSRAGNHLSRRSSSGCSSGQQSIPTMFQLCRLV
jgi:hypothetical protein